MKNQTLAKKIGTYADRNFYSTTGSAQKDIHIPYSITADLWSKKPSYCSKMVYQAYYYGSGNTPLMIKTYGTVAPYSILSFFNTGYGPSLVKIF